MGVMALINIPVIRFCPGRHLRQSGIMRTVEAGVNPVFKSADIELEQKTDFWN